jgi:hypothetical protein
MQAAKVVLVPLFIGLLISTAATHPLEFFIGVDVDHPNNVISGDARLWAVLKNDKSYVLKHRQIQVESYQYFAPNISDEPLVKRKLTGPDAYRAIIHFTGNLSLKEGPIIFDEVAHQLVHYSFNKKLSPQTPYEFELGGNTYRISAEVDQQQRLMRMKILLESDAASQLLWSHEGVSDPTARVEWVGDIDRDGKPDLLLTMGYHYSEVTKRLYFSSPSKIGQLVKEVGQLVISYD